MSSSHTDVHRQCHVAIHSHQAASQTTTTTTTTTTIIQSGEAPFSHARSLHPHSGELNHALSQAGGPTQSQQFRPMSSRHHITMENRPRRKQLNSDTNPSKKTYMKEIQEKRKEETFLLRSNEKKFFLSKTKGFLK